jgi:hypothetical protein
MSDELQDPKKADLKRFAKMVVERAKESPPNALENTKPEKAACILWHRANGDSYRSIRNKYKVGLATIKRMEIEYKDPLGSVRKEATVDWLVIASANKEALMKKMEQYEDDPELLKDVSPDRFSLTAAMAQDKAMALEGQASTIVEHRSGRSIEDAQEMIKQAKARVAEKKATIEIDAEVIDADVD